MADNSLALALSDTCYRALLHLYPRPFRRAYGREMALAFRDYCRRVVRREGTAGLLELWLVTFADLCSTALKERLTEVTEMSTASFIRLSGLVAAAGGLILLIAGFVDIFTGNPETPQFPFNYLIVLYGLAWAFGLAGFYNLHSYDNLGRAGLGLAFLGALLIGTGAFAMVFLPGDSGWSVWSGGTMLHLVGLTIFGISLSRGRVLPQGNLLPLLAGVVPIIPLLGLIDIGPWEMLPLMLSGASWVALGALLVRLSGESMVPMSPAA